MSPALAVREPDALAVTSDQLDLIRRTIAKDATPDELKLYLYDCQRQGVHPLDKLIHFTKRAGKYTPVTSIDFMRIRAAESGEYAGSDVPLFAGDEGIWSSLGMGTKPPTAAMVTVWRLVQGQRCKFEAIARWAEYKPAEDFMWRKMPHTMLGKCAEALALRKGFPRQLAGLYAKEELDQADAPKGYVVETPAAAKHVAVPSVPNGGDSGQLSDDGPDLISDDAEPPAGLTIVDVRPGKAGAAAEIVLSNGMSLQTYKTTLRDRAQQYRQAAVFVQLETKRSAAGNEYITGITRVPDPPTPAALEQERIGAELARQAGEIS